MTEQPVPENNLIRSYLRFSLLTAALLLALLVPLVLLLPDVISSVRGRVLIILLVLLTATVGMILYRLYRMYVLPAQHLLQNLITLGQDRIPLNDAPVPGLWKPWFSAQEKIFQSLVENKEEVLRRNDFLQQLVRERTAELELVNSALGEELEERSMAESALQEINKKLREVSLVDGLTGMANRRKFEEYLRQMWKQMARDQAPLSLVLCEIDHFQNFKGTYGYQAGDHCLRKIARVIQETLQRPGDLAARYEGEKFLVLLPGTGSRGAIQVAEKLQQGIAELEISHGAFLSDSLIDFTIGLASTFPEREGSPEDLLKTAEHALERARDKSSKCLAV
jgi:diguanylate cyclase (GGDEF)-like protein